ncbi:MAG TPA: FG-GAP-like repeat-containing protein [Nocardioidaceae bacterium]|nr:FG-GAP-like repeat-containing protein [Nocardioidaceae bacterium]
MPHDRSRLVLLCQQTLVLGVVAAVAAPAANLVTIDIVAPPASAQASAQASARTSAGATRATGVADTGPRRSLVATAPVRPTVAKVPLSGVTRAGVRALAQPTAESAARPLSHREGVALASAGTGAAGTADGTLKDAGLAVLSSPQPVQGLATVGVTWAAGAKVPDGTITVSVRTEKGGTWSGWMKVPYHQDEGPDPSSAEGRAATPGTDPIYVGAVDELQVKALTDSGKAPAGMQLSLVDPGRQRSRVEAPGIDTGSTGTGSADGASTGTGAQPSATTTGAEATAALSAAAVTPRPTIYSRAQWGADERMRDRASLHYGEVHGGFVHHTVNANNYTAAQVPAILRGIYAYHTQSRGWSDIGYNFLVDRFGRIWEGRYGGVARPVVGAHTLGYNDDSFAMSAIGNYDIAQPSAAMLAAYGRLFAWKLGLHGVKASSTHQWITSRYFNAISGHRDAGQTACPGRYLYAKLPTIRALATADQRGWAGRVRVTSLAGSSAPDLVARDRTTKKVYILRSGGSGTRIDAVVSTGRSFRHADLVRNVGDWNGDGKPDVVTRSGRTGLLYLYPGNGAGGLGRPVLMSRSSFATVHMIAGVGDMTGDGRPDLMGQRVGRNMRIYPGNGRTGFLPSYDAHSALPGRQQIGVGLWNGDGAPDSVIRQSDSKLMLYPGNGPGGLTGGKRIGTVMPAYGTVVSPGDLTGDGRADLVMRQTSNGRLWLRPGTPRGFGAKRTLSAATGRFDLIG